MKKKSVEKASLVLSGGGGLGLAHIGALQVLEKNYEFEYYAGVSSGAIVAACHACGYTADEISDIVHDQNFLSFALDRSTTNFGFVHGKKVLALLEKIFKGKTFEDIEKLGKILRVYATDFQTGKRICFSSGEIMHAVMASISVPILFDPYFYNDMFLVDGGLSGNFPMEETLDEYSGKCIGIDIATGIDQTKDFSEKTFFGKPKGIQLTLERTFRIFFQSQQHFNVHDKRVSVLKPDLIHFKTIDIFKLKEIEKKGKECAENFLQTFV